MKAKRLHLLLIEDEADGANRTRSAAQQFVDNVSQKFRQPLAIFREFTLIVPDGCDGTFIAKQIERLEKVLHCTEELAPTVDYMLDISKLETGRLGVSRRPSRVTDMIANVVGSLALRAASKNIRLIGKLTRDLPPVFCDEEQAQLALIHLVIDAVKFTPAGGHIEVWARLAEGGEEIVVGVTDSGSGISPQNLEIHFQRFKQLKTNLQVSTKGFGLRLNVAKELANLDLGQMHVESELGEGSTFSFRLPCKNREIVSDGYAKRTVALTDALLRGMTSNESVQGTPLVVLSANIRDQHRALEAGATYFISKPYEASTVISAIESSLNGWSIA